MGSVRVLAAFLAAVLGLQFPAPAAPSRAASLSARLTEVGAWSDGAASYTQYEISIENSGGAVTDWRLTLDAPAGLAVSQSWNCNLARAGGELTLSPVDYNREIPAGGTLNGVGLIVSGGKLTVKGMRAAQDGAGVTIDSAAPEPSVAVQPVTPAKPSVPKTAGKLHVDGTRLADEAGNPVQLRGVSTHGLAWFPQYVSEETFRTLRDGWGANTVRLAMYTAEYGGYCAGGDRAALKALIDKGVQAATKLGMYAVIDWHILSDGDPRAHQADAAAFFGELSAKYAAYPNVLYEICNEPNGAPWDTAIAPYAKAVLAAIRKNAPDAVVIVGTNTWSQDVDAVIGKRLDDPNVVYAFHFYAATHGAALRQKLERALDAGVPCFVSECGISEASGQGRVDTASGQAWLELLNRRGVSFVAWGLSNKAETVSLLNPGCAAVSGWKETDLTESGKWFRNAIRS